MKKEIKLIIAIVIAVAILIAGIVYFFVVFKENDASKFIGTWEQIEGVPLISEGFENYSVFESYYNNYSFKYQVINKSTGEILGESWFIYKVEFGKLYIKIDESGFSEPISYSFSNDDTKLTIRGYSGSNKVYSKVS